MHDVLVVVGTRPEAIKLAPVVRRLTEVDGIRPIVLGTGQHPEMTREMTRLFDVGHDADLDVHTRGQTLPQLLARVVSGVGAVMDDVKPSAVIVQGDTTTTLGAALAAVTSELPLVHLEAGLRSGDLRNPFPEELNRRAIAPVAALHLAATPDNRSALLREGIPADRVATVGNTVIDAFNWVRSLNRPWDDASLAAFCEATDSRARPVVLVTMHRRESWGEPTEAVAHAVRSVAAARPDLRVVWPV
ncbi:MAG TPA: UDP-N-acetylglucosamine 2-epimerase (non-hydrolyzing), partial [Ornithinibacter sp.]|nr:UDP-N-acetylglucosamine 2-epimerase (non-hydrolyzing) [Ornithinibacter sp.]